MNEKETISSQVNIQSQINAQTYDTKENNKTSVEKILVESKEEDLNALKSWMFQENIRMTLENQRLCEKEKLLEELEQALEERKKHFIKEKSDFRNEMNLLNHKMTVERQRLKQDSLFFEKKMDILKNGFAELEEDRKRFEKEKKSYYARNRQVSEKTSEISVLFKGVNNLLTLKKRYRDLVKIFHPDNLCGDSQTFRSITKEYEKRVEEYKR